MSHYGSDPNEGQKGSHTQQDSVHSYFGQETIAGCFASRNSRELQSHPFLDAAFAAVVMAEPFAVVVVVVGREHICARYEVKSGGNSHESSHAN